MNKAQALFRRRPQFAMVPVRVLRDGTLPTGPKVLYAVLVSYAWDAQCFPGEDRLAQDCGVTRQTVSAWVRVLRERGLISTVRRGQGQTNLYIIEEIEEVTSSEHNYKPATERAGVR